MKNLAYARSLVNPLLVTLALFTLAAASAGWAQGLDAQQPPDGFGVTIVYMGTGVYDADDAGYEAPDGDVFHREIMGRSDAEIAQDRADAVAFFETRFGLNPDEDEGLMMTDFMLDPRNEYRAYLSSETPIPSEGWVIRDGGWNLSVTDPDGRTLGGEFEGTHVPMGAMFVYGDYNIDVPGDDPIVIHYQSGSPIVMGMDGMMFRCEISHSEWGTGLAQGISAPAMLDDGRTHANIRNVLTFPGLGDPGGVPNAQN